MVAITASSAVSSNFVTVDIYLGIATPASMHKIIVTIINSVSVNPPF